MSNYICKNNDVENCGILSQFLSHMKNNRHMRNPPILMHALSAVNSNSLATADFKFFLFAKICRREARQSDLINSQFIHRFTAGLFFIIPCTDSFIKVDLRTASFEIPPQEVRIKSLQSHCEFRCEVFNGLMMTKPGH
jgi:hypothetical protein